MKSKEEIEQLAKLKYSYEYGIETNVTDDLRQCFIETYTQCQKDMADYLKKIIIEYICPICGTECKIEGGTTYHYISLYSY